MKRRFFIGLSSMGVALLVLLGTGSAQAENLTYLSLGYQKAQWDSDSNQLSGSGWYLDGQYPLSDKLGLVGSFSRVDYKLMDLTDWQIGGRFQQSLFFGSVIGLEYRYINLIAEAGDKDADELGHQGAVDLHIALGSSGRSSKPGILELGAALTAYESEDRELLSVGYRAYLNRSFSLALHLQQESDDRRWLTLSVREEK